MKIAFLRRKVDIHGGGAEKVAANFVSEFLDRGHSITVFAESFKGEKRENLEWVRVSGSPMSLISKTHAFHKNVQKALRGRDFDIVYSMCRTYPADVFRVTEQLHTEWLPMQYSLLSRLNPRHRLITRLEHELFSPDKVRRVVTNSELVKRQVHDNFLYPEDRITVIRNGVDREKYHPLREDESKDAMRQKLRIPQKNFALLFVATNFKIKGLESAIRSVAKMEPDVRDNTVLVVVGGDKPGPFVKLARGLGVENNLLFKGAASNMREYYVSADMLFYPSMYEPFANVCLEASACGLPSLTTSLNGSSEIFANGKSGYIVSDHTQTDEMAEMAMEFFRKSEDDRAAFADNARAASSAYNWKKHASELERLFEETLREKRK